MSGTTNPNTITIMDSFELLEERIEFTPVDLYREVSQYGGKLACVFSWMVDGDDFVRNDKFLYVGKLKPSLDVFASWKHKESPTVEGYELERALRYRKISDGIYLLDKRDDEHSEHKVCVPADMFSVRGCSLAG